jgi:hypothetical protein
MNTIRTAAAAIFALALCAEALAQSEGVAEFRGTMTAGPGKSIPSAGRFYLTKSAYRMEWEVDLSSIAQKEKDAAKGMVPSHTRVITIQKLSDLDHILNLNEERKLYSITDLKKLREGAPARTQETYSVKKLGRDSVAGFSCEKALVTSSGGSESELCVSAGLFPSAAWTAAESRRDRSSNMMKALRDAGLEGFPIRWAIRSRGEKQATSTMELVRFEKKSVPSSAFEVPPGYKQTSDTTINLSPEQEKAMNDAQKQMKEAIDKLPPEQRKQYEEMMKKQKGDQ